MARANITYAISPLKGSAISDCLPPGAMPQADESRPVGAEEAKVRTCVAYSIIPAPLVAVVAKTTGSMSYLVL